MLIGYARVSTNDQETAAEVAALKAEGCARINREKASGGRWDRPEPHRLSEAEAGFRSPTEAIDTTMPAGRMMMQMAGALAEFERAMPRERTKAGFGCRPPGRANLRAPAEALAATTGGDRTDGVQGR